MNQLLAAYGSDDSEESDSDKLHFKSETGNLASSSATKTSSSHQDVVRGKRIIGLNAILPREISDRLTRSSVQGFARTAADYDSSDESSDEFSTAPRPRSEQQHVTSVRHATDRGLENFLTELHSLQPTNVGYIHKVDVDPGSSLNIMKGKEPENVGINIARSHRNVDETIHRHSNNNSSRIMNAAPAIFSHLECSVPNTTDDNTITNLSIEEGTSPEYQQPQYKRRKELERELRKGNLSFIEENQEVHTVHQSISDYRSTDQLLSSSQMHNRKSSVPIIRGPKPLLQTYIPKEGVTVAQSDLTSRQKSKHQIHSLVASAVALQAKRNQEASILLNKGTMNSGNSRSDAKRKYGW